MKEKKRALATEAVHAGAYLDREHGSVTTPIYPSSTFLFRDPGEVPFYNYARCNHPTREGLQQQVAALEGGYRAFATASGMLAIQVVASLLKQGDHVICGFDAYAGTHRLFDKLLRRFGLDFSFIDMRDPGRVKEAITPRTRMIWIETPSNPMMGLTDIAACAELADGRDIIVVVDNTFLTPALQRPIELGADVVVHSTTKYLNGHSDVIGGAVVCADEAVATEMEWLMTTLGCGQSPFDAFLVQRGIKTLTARMEVHQRNARALAHFLEAHPAVSKVYYPGLENFPQEELMRRQQDGPGGMLSFELHPNKASALTLARSVEVFQLAVSLGGVESLMELPWSMSHLSMDEGAKRASGLHEGLIRLSPGIEDAGDLIADLEQALECSLREK